MYWTCMANLFPNAVQKEEGGERIAPDVHYMRIFKNSDH